MKYQISLLLLIILLSQSALTAKLKICLNRPIIEINPSLFEEDQIAKEVLFKNIYETLFYYSSSTNKIKANIAAKIEKLSEGKYLLKLNKNVQFHNNKIFTVKKYVDYKDVIFSLKKSNNQKVKNLKITKQGLELTSDLNLKELYLELASSKNTILSRAYWRYLKKKKKTELFYKRPIGTGPFTLSGFSLPYKLIQFDKYHLTNRLKSISYITSKDYIKDSCDIFWDNTNSKKRNYETNLGYNSHSSDYDSLIFVNNIRRNQLIYKVIDPLDFNENLLKTLDSKVTKLAIPPMLKQAYLINKKNTKLNEKEKIVLSIDQRIYELFDKKNFNNLLKRFFSKQNVNLEISEEKSNIHLTIQMNLKNKFLLNKNLYCKYKTKACNKISNTKELESILLDENKIIPLSFYKRNIFYRKNITNIQFDFLDTIDYSEIFFLQR